MAHAHITALMNAWSKACRLVVGSVYAIRARFSSKMSQQQHWTYPVVKRDDSIVDDHYGTSVPDPYRWLEDPDSEETRAFVAAQNEISEPYLAACEVRDIFKERSILCLLV